LQNAQQANALGKMRMQAAQEEMAQAAQQRNALAQFQQSIPSPQMQASQAALQGGGGPTVQNAAQMRPVDPRLQMLHGAMRSGLVAPMDYLNQAMPAPKAPEYKVVGGSLVKIGQDGVQEAYRAPEKAEGLPSGMRMGANGPEWIPGYLEGKQKVAKAGATNVAVTTEKGLLGTIADKTGADVVNTAEAARGAQSTLSTVGEIRAALKGGKAITGTAANQRLTLAQFGETIGMGPANNPETLSKTRELMMGLGQMELDAAAQMKGQGQITESERAILRRAAAGDITMTGPELETLANVMEKRAKRTIERNKTNMQTLKGMPNAASVVPFLEANGEPAGGFRMPTAADIAAEAARRAAARGGK
jgi:hypothetical protein